LALVNGNARGPDEIVHVGFEPACLRPAFDGSTFPYLVVIEVRKPPGLFATCDRIERDWNTKFRKDFENGAGGNANFGPITLERGKHRFLAEFTGPAPNGLRLRGKLFGFLGKENVVMVPCSSREIEFVANLADFDATGDSFQFDPGYEFKPFGNETIVYIVGFVCAGCCRVLTIAIGVGGLIYVLNKK